MSEYAQTELQVLQPPKSPPDMNLKWMTNEQEAPGQVVAQNRTTAAEAYKQLLGDMDNQHGLPGELPGYWTVSPVTYSHSETGALTPKLADNPLSVWYTGGISSAAMDDEDNQFRVLTPHSHDSPAFTTSAGPLAAPRLVGVFDASKIKSFDQLSEVPLGAYQPVAASPENPVSEKALDGSNLLPNLNIGGYVSQPVNLITTLSALPALQNSGHYSGTLHVSDPISVIRVRVAGVTGPNSVSLERIKEVAQQIALLTHLDVDIVAGSSPSPTTIALPAGKFGQPALELSENWVKKGVATAILNAIDEKSVVLFVLILLVCILFVANSAWAAIRARRQELGLLACLGWTRPRLFATVLGEQAAIGLVAGILGALAALPLSSTLALHASEGRAALAVPIAVVVSVVAGLIPAFLATRAEPVESVRPPVLAVRRAHNPGGITAMAAMNVLRTPGRALIASASLAIGITALTVLTAVTFAFRGVLVGTLLGDAVAVQVRGVDYVAVVATIVVGVIAVADVIFLNIRERAAELAAIRTFGWRESMLSRMVVTEGVIIGLVGSLTGAAIGLYVAADFAGQLPDRLYAIAAAEIIAGVIVTASAALLPAQMLRRLPDARFLAEE